MRAAPTRAATSAEPSRAGGVIRSAAETDGHVDDEIEAIEERAGKAAEILRHAALVGRALAGVARLVGRAAAAGVHRRDQLEPRRIDDAMVGARDRHFAGLDRLAQAVQDLGLELRQFVEEEDAVVGERNLAGPGVRAAADQRRHRGRMMGAAERAPVGQRAAGEDAGDRMDHRHFEQFARGRAAAGSTAGAGRASIFPRRARRSSAGCGRRPPPLRARAWRSPGP